MFHLISYNFKHIFNNSIHTWTSFYATFVYLYRQEVQELHAEAVRQQAEFEAWHKQQELLLQGEEQRRRILQEEENKLAQQRSRSLSLSSYTLIKVLHDAIQEPFCLNGSIKSHERQKKFYFPLQRTFSKTKLSRK